MSINFSLFAVSLLLSGCIAAGVVAAVIHTWSLRALAFSLETRLAVVEGTLTREVKARAGQERWKNPGKADAELLKTLTTQAAAAPHKGNWWENPNLKKGAYVP